MEYVAENGPRLSFSLRAFWHHINPSNCWLGLHLYSRYAALSEFTRLPRANPTTAYLAGDWSSEADAEEERHCARMSLAGGSPGKIPRCASDWSLSPRSRSF